MCCARPETVRWIEARNGLMPPNAIAAGNTSNGEPLYVGRAKHERSLTPGKVSTNLLLRCYLQRIVKLHISINFGLNIRIIFK